MSLEATLDADPTQIASILDHTNVDPAATAAEIRTLCREVREHDFCSAVVVPYHAPLAHERLDGAANVVAVVGFPYGIQNASAKRAEVEALRPYVDEFDMVMNRTAFANGDDEAVIDDVAAVRDAVGDRPLKCIIESPTLDPEAITHATGLVESGGADYVKTAVGYDGPTTREEIDAIRAGIGDDTAIKASGGISTYEEAMAMVRAGASRIGASSSVEILESSRDHVADA